MIPRRCKPDEYELHVDTYNEIVAAVKAENMAAFKESGDKKQPKWNANESIAEIRKRHNQWLESRKTGSRSAASTTQK